MMRVLIADDESPARDKLQRWLSEQADVMYKQSAYYDDALERGISYEDPDVAIAWPEGIDLKPSPRDAGAPLLRDIEAELPFVYEPPSAA